MLTCNYFFNKRIREGCIYATMNRNLKEKISSLSEKQQLEFLKKSMFKSMNTIFKLKPFAILLVVFHLEVDHLKGFKR